MVLINSDMRIGALGTLLTSGGWAAIQGTALLAGGVFWSTPAAADCALPQPALAFSYPDSTTEWVPANAVFWAAGTTGAVARVSLDGVELSPLGAALHERVQFAPPEPLALGSHELTITVPRHPQAGDTDMPVATETFRFEVTEPDSFDANPEIVSVTTYPILFSPGQRPHPPEEAYEGDCSARVVDLGASCFDIIPESLVRVELVPDPRARGYVMGNYLLPADCEVFFPYQYAQPDGAPYAVAAILPTGLGAEAPFEGTAERVEYDPSPGTYRDGPPGWCALSFGARSPGSAGTIAALGWAAALIMRRRVRPVLDRHSRTSRTRLLCVPVMFAAAGSTLSGEAHARCAYPPMDLALSYPDANTPAIPPDALIWLVPIGGGLGGSMAVELDGAPLPAVGTTVPERYQFRPAEPLSLGEHQLDVRLEPVEGNTSPAADKTLSFRVAELEERTGDVDALRAARFFSNDAPEVDQACAAQTLYLGGCDDIAPPAVDRLDFAPIGDPLFYLVNGTLIHSVGCETANLGVWEPDGPVTHQVTAVLPTGLGPVREIEALPSASSASEAGCSVGRSATGTAPGWLLAMLFVLSARRRKTPQV